MGFTVFITGATGNIGGKLAAHILQERSDIRLKMLVRAGSVIEARSRVEQTIKVLSPEFDIKLLRERCDVICGDVTADLLGLAPSEYADLAAVTTHIIHCAATTKFTVSLEEARAVNVDGTKRVMEFARKAKDLGGLTGVAHISTAYACGDQSGTIYEDEFDDRRTFSNPYEQSKWEAEQFLYTLFDDLPITIFRPSIVIGDSRTGRINDFNVLYTPLKLILDGKIRVLPCRSDTPLDVVPLDYVAEIIYHAFFNSRPEAGRIFHVVAGAGNETAVGDIVSGAIACWKRFNRSDRRTTVRYIPTISGGIGRRFCSERFGRAFPLLHLYQPYIGTTRHFDNAKSAAVLRSKAIMPPSIDTYWEIVMRLFFDCGMGKRARSAA